MSRQYRFIPLPTMLHEPFIRGSMNPHTIHHTYWDLPQLACHVIPPFIVINSGLKLTTFNLDEVVLNLYGLEDDDFDTWEQIKAHLTLLCDIWILFKNSKDDAKAWVLRMRVEKCQWEEDPDTNPDDRQSKSTGRTTLSQDSKDHSRTRATPQSPTPSHRSTLRHLGSKWKDVPSSYQSNLTERAIAHHCKQQKGNDSKSVVWSWLAPQWQVVLHSWHLLLPSCVSICDLTDTFILTSPLLVLFLLPMLVAHYTCADHINYHHCLVESLYFYLDTLFITLNLYSYSNIFLTSSSIDLDKDAINWVTFSLCAASIRFVAPTVVPCAAVWPHAENNNSPIIAHNNSSRLPMFSCLASLGCIVYCEYTVSTSDSEIVVEMMADLGQEQLSSQSALCHSQCQSSALDTIVQQLWTAPWRQMSLQNDAWGAFYPEK